jgi:hypothetical protein
MVAYRLLADLVLVLHIAYVTFVVGGLAAIGLGAWRGWGWVRNPWFRTIHLGMIAIVVAESGAAVACPLTTLENTLRRRGGQQAYELDFVAYWLHRAMFFRFEPWVFVVAYSLFGLAVVGSLILVPPRRRRGPVDPEGLDRVS